MPEKDRIQWTNQLIQQRRSVYPAQYNGKQISRQDLEQILENANWAPTHKLTQPWRFKVITGDARGRLADFMAGKYEDRFKGDQFNPVKYQKVKSNPRKAGAIILICMQRDPKERVPEWEETASVAIAVQNMWLTCHSLEIGAYWSSPPFIHDMEEFVELNPGEKCIGIFYMGYYDKQGVTPDRNPSASTVNWIEE